MRALKSRTGNPGPALDTQVVPSLLMPGRERRFPQAGSRTKTFHKVGFTGQPSRTQDTWIHPWWNRAERASIQSPFLLRTSILTGSFSSTISQ